MMEKFDVVTGVAAPMLMNNINTDLIAPSHFPGKKPEEAVLMTLRDKMFANLRFHPDGAPQPDFVLNQTSYRDARFILAGPNFGDIFHDNAHQNGLLPLKLDVAAIERLANALQASNASELTVDLLRCEL